MPGGIVVGLPNSYKGIANCVVQKSVPGEPIDPG